MCKNLVHDVKNLSKYQNQFTSCYLVFIVYNTFDLIILLIEIYTKQQFNDVFTGTKLFLVWFNDYKVEITF